MELSHSGSPAIDTVTGGTCPPSANDQRGISQLQEGNGDGGGGAALEHLSTSRRPYEAVTGIS
ncbi:MAG TPA: hypothetical protein VKB53_13530 [Gammaproteobacteria bacterium]|nr:hypothetical protein [Gammaproteobacteria bacterium]